MGSVPSLLGSCEPVLTVAAAGCARHCPPLPASLGKRVGRSSVLGTLDTDCVSAHAGHLVEEAEGAPLGVSIGSGCNLGGEAGL